MWISQHEARPASAQRRNGRRLAAWMGPAPLALEGDAGGPHPADSGVAYVWQMDPYNGKVIRPDSRQSAQDPLQYAPSATSVSNRVATVKTQPQLYWNFPEDNKFMIKWFDSFFTNSMWASTSTNKLNEEQYPMVPGLYINYSDS